MPPRKRKSRPAEPAQEPDTAPLVKSEPHDQPEADPEQINHPVEEQTQLAGVGEQVEEEVEVEEEEEEEEEEQPNEIKSEPVDTVMTEKPSESVGGELLNGTEEVKKEKDGEEEEGDLEEEPLEKLLEPFTKDQMTLLIKEAVAKHPDIVENVHKLADADPAHRKIFVHGLGWEAVSEMIVSVFGKYGEIEDCKVVRDKLTGKSKGYGFILFKHRDGARRALKQPQKLIEGRMTSCQLASAGPVQAPSPTVAAASVSTPPVSEYTQRKIYVSNVSAELDPRKLLEYFGQFGEIEEGPLGLDKQTGRPRGFCLFVYKSLEGAKKALEEPHKTYEGQTLHCQKAVDGPKHSKGGHFQQHGQQHHHQGYHNHPAKKGRFSGGGGGSGHAGGHLMAPSVPPMGFNPAVAPAAIGQAVAALLASHGGLGIGNLLGGAGPGPNQQGIPPMMNNAGYPGQSGYPGQPGVQGGYAAPPQMGQGGVRPHQGGPPYMGHGR